MFSHADFSAIDRVCSNLLLLGISRVQSQTTLLCNGLMNFDHHACLRLIFTCWLFELTLNNFLLEVDCIHRSVSNPVNVCFLKGNNVSFSHFYCVRVQVIFFHNSRNGMAKRLVKSMYITTGVSVFYSNVLKSTKKWFSGVRNEILMRSAKWL